MLPLKTLYKVHVRLAHTGLCYGSVSVIVSSSGNSTVYMRMYICICICWGILETHGQLEVGLAFRVSLFEVLRIRLLSSNGPLSREEVCRSPLGDSGLGSQGCAQPFRLGELDFELAH